jgi:aryl-alcohol dehydrogenase-like predicted oxidoreductase
VLLEVAKELGRPAAEIALNWVVTQPGVTSTLIGATKIPQLDSNLKALDFAIPAKLRKRLDEVSQLESAHPYTFSGDFFKNMISGGVPVRAWSAAANR